MADDAADLSLLARQQRQIMSELGMRDDMAVLTAIAMRQDGTLAALLTEVRAMHSQHSIGQSGAGVRNAAVPELIGCL